MWFYLETMAECEYFCNQRDGKSLIENSSSRNEVEALAQFLVSYIDREWKWVGFVSKSYRMPWNFINFPSRVSKRMLQMSSKTWMFLDSNGLVCRISNHEMYHFLLELLSIVFPFYTVECGSPPAANSNSSHDASGSQFDPGHMVTYSCESGFTIDGGNQTNTTLTCELGGTWSPVDAPYCNQSESAGKYERHKGP